MPNGCMIGPANRFQLVGIPDDQVPIEAPSSYEIVFDTQRADDDPPQPRCKGPAAGST